MSQATSYLIGAAPTAISSASSGVMRLPFQPLQLHPTQARELKFCWVVEALEFGLALRASVHVVAQFPTPGSRHRVPWPSDDWRKKPASAGMRDNVRVAYQQ